MFLKSYSDQIWFLETSYIEQIHHLFSLSKKDGKASLQNMQTMSRLLNHPEKKLRIIHIAGTNGKGSVCWKIAKAFEFSGLRCGLFTSPHLCCFRERIRIGDNLIEEEAIENLLFKICTSANEKGLCLTYFEYCTLLAFEYFAEKKVDVAVIEVGIGGRLDATNIAIPELSIITSIGLDHTEILGSTIEEIAIEKGGIIKAQIPVLIGPRVPVRPIEKIAAPLNSSLSIVPERNLPFHLENASIAEEAVRLLSTRFIFNQSRIAQALAIDPPCRFEEVLISTLKRSPLGPEWKHANVILDVAHNPQGFERLLQRLCLKYPNRKFHFMINLGSNKNISACIALLLSKAKSIYIPRMSHPRLSPPESLLPHFRVCDIPVLIDDSESLLRSYIRLYGPSEILVVCGSFFMMGQIRKLLGYIEPQDPLFSI